MRILKYIFIIGLPIGVIIFGFSFSNADSTYSYEEEVRIIRSIGPNDVHLAGNGVKIPIGRILLVRKNGSYGLLRFIKHWDTFSGRFKYADYESYFIGDFLRKDSVVLGRHTASAKFIMRFIFLGNQEVICGPIRLFWSGGTTVYFYGKEQEEADYGVELAPTPWTQVSQIDLFDPRIKWFGYDGQRKRLNIPIDNIWSNFETNQ